MYILLLTCKLNLTLNSTPTEQTFPNDLLLLLFSVVQMCVAFVIPVLCLLHIVLCSSLSCHFHDFSQNVVMPEIFPSQLSVPVIIPHSTCSDCHSVFSLMLVLLVSFSTQAFCDSRLYYSILVKHHVNM